MLYKIRIIGRAEVFTSGTYHISRLVRNAHDLGTTTGDPPILRFTLKFARGCIKKLKIYQRVWIEDNQVKFIIEEI